MKLLLACYLFLLSATAWSQPLPATEVGPAKPEVGSDADLYTLLVPVFILVIAIPPLVYLVRRRRNKRRDDSRQL